MDTRNREEFSEFIDLVVDCRDSGARVFNAWVEKEPKLLKKSDPEFFECLRSLTKDEVDKLNVILPMLLKTSFYSLLEALELGKDGLEFELFIKKVGAVSWLELIGNDSDLEIRNEVDIR